jgi:hypothetical protein
MSVQDVVNFMLLNNDDPDMMNKFYEIVNRHDDYRKESFEHTFNEFYTLLKTHEK